MTPPPPQSGQPDCFFTVFFFTPSLSKWKYTDHDTILCGMILKTILLWSHLILTRELSRLYLPLPGYWNNCTMCTLVSKFCFLFSRKKDREYQVFVILKLKICDSSSNIPLYRIQDLESNYSPILDVQENLTVP